MIRIAQITDIHLDEKYPFEHGVKADANWINILNDISKREIDQIIFTGDIGSKESNRWFFNSLKKFTAKFKFTLGNHDTFPIIKDYYNMKQNHGRSELFYSIEEEYFKFVFMDSSSARITQHQFNWFQKEIITDKKIILFVHHPILETGSTPQKEFPFYDAVKIKNELLKHTTEVHIFCGHLHFDDEAEEENIQQFVTPSACYQAKKHSEKTEFENASYGYRLIEINKDKIESEVILFEHI